MKQIKKWLRPRSSRIYLHPCHSQRLVTVYPDMKITDLDLKDNGWHYNQPAFGVHMLFGNEPSEADMELTRWKTPEKGLPVYTMYNRDSDSGCDLEMTAFCSTHRIPYTYCRVRVTNNTTRVSEAVVGLLARYNKKDHYLTGLHDTGYEPYDPNVGQWYLRWLNGFSPISEDTVRCEDGYGEVKVLSHCGFDMRWVSRNEQKNRFKAHDYYRFSCLLGVGESAEVTFVMRRGGVEGHSGFEDALSDSVAWWSDVQSRVTRLPADSRYEDMFRQNITQMLQMLQHYEGQHPDKVYARQGDVGRFQWIWEAAHYTTVLDDVGLGEFCTQPIRMWYDAWQITEGEKRGLLDNPYVKWDNNNGSALWATAHHLMTMGDRQLFLQFKPKMELALEYIQYRRSLCGEKEVQGLFSSGQASDWGEIGQHWTYTDAVNVYGIGEMAQCYEMFGAENADEIRKVYEQYRGVILDIIQGFSRQHTGEKSYNMPHILGVEFEDSYNHCFYTDGCPYLIKLGFMDPHSEIFVQMENFYREAGFLDDEHGLSGRMTNDDCGSPGLYGNVYYTCVSEICWIEAFMRRGETDKAQAYANGILNYHVTPEYIASERYCSTNEWFTPWQPNASGSGRLCRFLLDYFGSVAPTGIPRSVAPTGNPRTDSASD